MVAFLDTDRLFTHVTHRSIENTHMQFQNNRKDRNCMNLKAVSNVNTETNFCYGNLMAVY